VVAASLAAATDLDAAYAACEREVRTHYENFPVASWLLPRGMRRDVAAVYAFARAADDFADEGNRAAEERLRLLDGWGRRLRQAADSPDPGPARREGEPANTVAVFLAVGATIRSKDLPLGLFEDLLSAFRQDVTVSRYATWVDLLDYCRRSANPVGRLVLRIAGHRDPRLDAWSDAVCTALQLTNFWQDMAADAERGRVYLPEEEDASRGPRALGSALERTRALFEQGRPLCDALRGRLRLELRATWLGGVRILDKVAQSASDRTRSRPRLGAADLPWFAARLLLWPRASSTA
jgi:squalene synthase HpnC